eukprot:607952-Prymnesium_polylepis.1
MSHRATSAGQRHPPSDVIHPTLRAQRPHAADPSRAPACAQTPRLLQTCRERAGGQQSRRPV